MGKCLFFFWGKGEAWSGGTGNRSDLKHKNASLVHSQYFKMAFSSKLQVELCAITSIVIRGSKSFGRCWGLYSSHCKLSENSLGGGKGFWLRRGWFASPNMRVSPAIKLLLTEVVGCFYWLMLFKPLATGVNTLVFQRRRPAFLRIFQNSLCTGYVGFKGFGAGVFRHQRGRAIRHCFFPPISSSTSGNSRRHNGKGSCADRPRNQTGSRRSAARKTETGLAI